MILQKTVFDHIFSIQINAYHLLHKKICVKKQTNMKMGSKMEAGEMSVKEAIIVIIVNITFEFHYINVWIEYNDCILLKWVHFLTINEQCK